MHFRKIQLVDEEDFLACTIATTVLDPDIRNLKAIAKRIVEHGYDWCIANRDPHKDDAWWRTVRQIHEDFNWDELRVGDPITAKVHAGSLEFGSIHGFGGGCHRTIALAAAVVSNRVKYRPF